MPTTRVALVRPTVNVLEKFSKPVENLGIAYLAAALRRGGHEAILLDGMLHGWTVEETVAKILEQRADIVGFTVVLEHFPPHLHELVVALRRAGYDGVLLVGGHSVSFFPERILRRVHEIDAVVRGEGERAICAIADAVSSGTSWRGAPSVCWIDGAGDYRANPVAARANLDELGDPARDLTGDVISNDGLVSISSSRGCYARCTFCSIPRFYGLERGSRHASGDWVSRDVAGTAAEVTRLRDRFGLRELLFVDDEFFGGTEAGRARAISLAAALEERDLGVEFALSCRAENVDPGVFQRLVRGGLRHVFVGVETGADRALKLYGKRHSTDQNRRAVRIIKDLGISFQPGFMMFNHRSTLEELRASIDFLQEIGECKPITLDSSAEPHFGTPLVSDMARGGLLDDAGGLRVSCGFASPAVAALRTVATICALRFRPYMEFLAGVRSAVTYEWRRVVPCRGAAEEHLLDVFEDTVNGAFTKVVIDAIDDAMAHPRVAPERLIADARTALDGVDERLALARALVVAQIERAEGGISYTSQLDLITEQGERARPGGSHPSEGVRSVVR